MQWGVNQMDCGMMDQFGVGCEEDVRITQTASSLENDIQPNFKNTISYIQCLHLMSRRWCETCTPVLFNRSSSPSDL